MDPMLEGAQSAMDEMIDRSRARLNHHRRQGGDDDQFLENLIKEFVEEAKRQPLGAGAPHMAVSMYKLTMQAEKIAKLEEDLAMRDAALKTMWDIEAL